MVIVPLQSICSTADKTTVSLRLLSGGRKDDSRSHHQHHPLEQRTRRRQEVKAGDVSTTTLRPHRHSAVVSAHQRDVVFDPAQRCLLVREAVVTMETRLTWRKGWRGGQVSHLACAFFSLSLFLSHLCSGIPAPPSGNSLLPRRYYP